MMRASWEQNWRSASAVFWVYSLMFTTNTKTKTIGVTDAIYAKFDWAVLFALQKISLLTNKE